MIDDLTPEQRESLRALRSTRGACPPAEALVGYDALDAAGKAGHPQHAHVQICSRCQLALLHMAEPAAAAPLARWLLPLAALVVLAVGGTLLTRSGSTPPDTIRGTDLQIVAPAGSVDTLTEFVWQSPIRAERYRVTVTRGGDTAWQTETAALRVAAPRDGLERNVEYRWTVEAIDREGEVRMTSPPQPFTIR